MTPQLPPYNYLFLFPNHDSSLYSTRVKHIARRHDIVWVLNVILVPSFIIIVTYLIDNNTHKKTA